MCVCKANQRPAARGHRQKSADIIGGVIDGLSAAAFLVDDAHIMPAARIRAYESLGVVGGACDGAGDHVNGYTARGGRELVPSMECLWYVLKKVPQTCSLRPSDAEAIERLRIASSLSYRLASPTKGKSRAPHAQCTARAYVAMLAPRETGRALRELTPTKRRDIVRKAHSVGSARINGM